MRLFYDPPGRLRLTQGDRSYISVKPVWASPLSYPGQFLSLLDGKGNEIALFKDPESELTPENWAVLKRELHDRYLNGTIHKIIEAKSEFGSTYWTVITDRGQKEFVTVSLQENAQWLKPGYLVIFDVDGNRFEITDVEALDLASKKLLYTTV